MADLEGYPATYLVNLLFFFFQEPFVQSETLL